MRHGEARVEVCGGLVVIDGGARVTRLLTAEGQQVVRAGVQLVELEQMATHPLGLGQVAAVRQQNRPQELRIGVRPGRRRQRANDVHRVGQAFFPQELERAREQRRRVRLRRRACGLGVARAGRLAGATSGERRDAIRGALDRLGPRAVRLRRVVEPEPCAGDDGRGVAQSGVQLRGRSPLIVEGVVAVAEVEFRRDPAQRFRISEEEESTRGERVRNASDDEPHRVRGEVHDDVPAEDDVEGLRLPERGVVVEEIAFLERHHAADGVVEHEPSPVRPEVASHHLRRRLTQRPRRVVPTGRPGERRAIDVDAGDVDRPAGELHGAGTQQDRQRVRLFAGGAPRGQDAEPMDVRARALALGQRDLGKGREVIGMPEEVGLAHGELRRDGRELVRPSPVGDEPVEIFRAASPTPLLAPLLEQVREQIEPPVFELETEPPRDERAEPVHVGRERTSAHGGASPAATACHTSSGTRRPARSETSSSVSMTPMASTTSAPASRSNGGSV